MEIKSLGNSRTGNTLSIAIDSQGDCAAYEETAKGYRVVAGMDQSGSYWAQFLVRDSTITISGEESLDEALFELEHHLNMYRNKNNDCPEWKSPYALNF